MSQLNLTQSGTPQSAVASEPHKPHAGKSWTEFALLFIMQVLYLASFVIAFGFIVLMGMACDSQSNAACANAQTAVDITFYYVIFSVFCCLAAWISFATHKVRFASVIMLLPILYIIAGRIIAAQ